jgi:predicted DNA-binding transcriptional regulator YafY
LGLRQASEAALIKLLAALPSMQRRDAEFIRQRIHVDAPGWRSFEEAVPFLPTLQEAIWQERKLQLTYQRSDDTTVERLVDPLGLVAKGSVWYLVVAVEGEFRTYRVSRVQGAEITDEAFVRPLGFDLAAFWAQSSAEFKANLPKYPATLRLDPAALPWIRGTWRYARIEYMDPPEAEGWVKACVEFEVIEEACAYVLGLGPQVEVLEPRELREKVVQLAEEIVVVYTRRAEEKR